MPFIALDPYENERVLVIYTSMISWDQTEMATTQQWTGNRSKVSSALHPKPAGNWLQLSTTLNRIKNGWMNGN